MSMAWGTPAMLKQAYRRRALEVAAHQDVARALRSHPASEAVEALRLHGPWLEPLRKAVVGKGAGLSAGQKRIVADIVADRAWTGAMLWRMGHRNAS
eukprot:47154-Lingulodinium_polyedra.AAC.1